MFFHLEIKKTALFTFSGVLSENSIVDELVSAILTLQKRNPQVVLEFDLLELQSANSMGLLTWQRGLKKVELPIIYSRVPYWLINYFSIINGFPQEKLFFVKSFFVPYYSETKNDGTQSLKFVGSDIILETKDYSKLAENMMIDGVEYEPDFISSKVEKFFNDNQAKFLDFQGTYKEFIKD